MKKSYRIIFFLIPILLVLLVSGCETNDQGMSTSRLEINPVQPVFDSIAINSFIVVNATDSTIKWQIKSISSGDWLTMTHKVNNTNVPVVSGNQIYSGNDTIYFKAEKYRGPGLRTAILTIYAMNSDSSIFKIIDYRIQQRGAAAYFNLSKGGDKDHPILISTAEQLAELANDVNGGYNYSGKYFKQINDIDLINIPNWTPIGTVLNPFMGNYDGQSFEIKNMSILNSIPKFQGIGLFGVVNGVYDNYANINNVIVKGRGTSTDILATVSTATATTTAVVGGGVAGVVGIAEFYVNVKGCKNYANVSVAGASVGGVIGHIGDPTAIVGGWTAPNLSNSSTVTLKNSYNYGTIEVKTLYNQQNGGVVGCNLGGNIKWCANFGTFLTNNVSSSGGICGLNNGIIEECYNCGDIKGSETTPDTGNSLGGIVGFLNVNGEIRNCYNVGKIWRNHNSAGGVVGMLINNIVNFKLMNCYNVGQVQSNAGEVIGNFQSTNASLITTCISHCYALPANLSTKLIGNNSPAGLTDTQIRFLTEDQAMSQSNFMGWDFTNIWQIMEGQSYPVLKNNPPQ